MPGTFHIFQKQKEVLSQIEPSTLEQMFSQMSAMQVEAQSSSPEVSEEPPAPVAGFSIPCRRSFARSSATKHGRSAAQIARDRKRNKNKKQRRKKG